MAKGMRKNDTADYSSLVKELKARGPENLYLLWGEEDYLREQFLLEIKKLCLSEGAEEFNYKRFDGPAVDMKSLSDAVDSLPFFSRRTLIEVRDYDINKCRDDDLAVLKEITGDLPNYCTLVFVLGSSYEPDGRLSACKTIKANGRVIQFTSQSTGQLVKWIFRRFEAMGKTINKADAEYLIFVCGSLMNRLIPEVEKLSAYAKSDIITREDIDAVTQRIPEANVFEMTGLLASRDFDGAAAVLAELLASREPPIKLLAIIGQQMRNLYAARLAIDRGLGKNYVMKTCGLKYDFMANRLLNNAKGFSLGRLARAVELCAETDYRMKSSSADDEALLKELLLHLALGDSL
ncbi:MAG TPA: DNA polymerase III subunit delta [Clostridiales bacterium]|nr:DNA polymerase III subunit delta [Clostridiales bacterium]